MRCSSLQYTAFSPPPIKKHEVHIRHNNIIYYISKNHHLFVPVFKIDLRFDVLHIELDDCLQDLQPREVKNNWESATTPAWGSSQAEFDTSWHHDGEHEEPEQLCMISVAEVVEYDGFWLGPIEGLTVGFWDGNWQVANFKMIEMRTIDVISLVGYMYNNSITMLTSSRIIK